MHVGAWWEREKVDHPDSRNGGGGGQHRSIKVGEDFGIPSRGGGKLTRRNYKHRKLGLDWNGATVTSMGHA